MRTLAIGNLRLHARSTKSSQPSTIRVRPTGSGSHITAPAPIITRITRRHPGRGTPTKIRRGMPNHQLAETITFDRTLTKTKHLRCMRKTVRQMNTTMANRRRTAQLRASPSTRICRLSLPLRLPWFFLSSLGLPIVEPP